MKHKPTIISVIQEFYPDNIEYHTYVMKINLYSIGSKQKEKVFCSAYIYDGVVSDEDNHNFDVLLLLLNSQYRTEVYSDNNRCLYPIIFFFSNVYCSMISFSHILDSSCTLFSQEK